MKKVIICSLCFFLIKLTFPVLAQIPKSMDLREEGVWQKRDLSISDSRIVINPYQFDFSPVEIPPSKYSDRPSLPLNIAYLTTKNKIEQDRFGRQVENLVMIFQNQSTRNQEALSFQTSWTPHALFAEASYPDGTQIRTRDFFYDENVIVRNISSETPQRITLAGVIPESISFQKNRITLSHPNFNYIISCNENFGKIIYYPTEADLKAKTNSLPDHKNAAYWTVEIPSRKDILLTVGCAEKNISLNTLYAWTINPLKGDRAAKAYHKREADWNTYLESLPHPRDFKLHRVDSKGVSPEEIRKTYYKAWVFLSQSVLQPDKENFPYYQIVTGKPSLWDHGHPDAPFSAAWESFVGMQLYAYVQPDVSWSALKGMLSLVDEEGMLGGESLPSKKAETAWILYQVTKDKQSLEDVYPALSRYLNWRIVHPRWIYKGLTPENEKDAEFVVAGLWDIKFMVEIATELELTEDAVSWKRKYDRFYEDFLTWFWTTPQSLPVQHVNQYEGRDTYDIQTLTGLYVDELSGDYYESMLGLFYKHYDPARPFAGFDASKYPDVAYTVYGLITKNKIELARNLLEYNIRDIVLCNVFAETYLLENNRGIPRGVRPSIFGMASVIDFVLLKNNYFYQKGIPSVVCLFEENTGVENIRLQNKILNVKHSFGSDLIKISGNYLEQEKSIPFQSGNNLIVPVF